MAHRQTILLAITPVLEERADDFEPWLQSVVHPAVRAHQPELRREQYGWPVAPVRLDRGGEDSPSV